MNRADGDTKPWQWLSCVTGELTLQSVSQEAIPKVPGSDDIRGVTVEGEQDSRDGQEQVHFFEQNI